MDGFRQIERKIFAPNKVSSNKYYDDLTKQNSLIYQNWKVYRWVYNQLKQHPKKIKDELHIFVGEIPTFKMLEDYLPKQKGKLIELREHQQAALSKKIRTLMSSVVAFKVFPEILTSSNQMISATSS